MHVSSHARTRQRGLIVIVIAVTTTLVAAQAGDKKQDAKLDQVQRSEAQTIIARVDEVAAGKTVANTLPIRWEQQHFIKAQGDKTYVPFTVAIDPGALTTNSIALYLRVVKHGAPPEPPPAPAEGKSDKKAAEVRRYPFEDLYFFDVPAVAPGQPQRLRRAFAVPPGDYDVFVAVRERPATPATPAGPTATTGTSASAPATPPAASNGGSEPKEGVIKQTVTVEDFTPQEFTTSSVIVAEKVEVLQAPLATERQADSPYTFGQMRIFPAADYKFSKKSELSIVFWIYGTSLDQNTKKPDVNIEWKFYQKNGDKETYFNKTDPQALNAQTLPPNFDLSAGHQLPGSLVVPLASFPEGDYRLEVELTDKVANKTLKRDVLFSVTG
jgi:hypothetical protein